MRRCHKRQGKVREGSLWFPMALSSPPLPQSIASPWWGEDPVVGSLTFPVAPEQTRTGTDYCRKSKEMKLNIELGQQPIHGVEENQEDRCHRVIPDHHASESPRRSASRTIGSCYIPLCSMEEQTSEAESCRVCRQDLPNPNYGSTDLTKHLRL